MTGANRSGIPDDPHGDQQIEAAGAPRQAAEAAVIMLHGRGSTPSHTLRLIDEFLHRGVMYLAPQAQGKTWFPRSALAPLKENEPWFSSALGLVSRCVDRANAAGIPQDRVILYGFSQGGCLAAEFVARNPSRYGGVLILSGSLMGPEISARDGSLDGTPVFFGCGEDDEYVPAQRVRSSGKALGQQGGDITTRLYEGLDHVINDDEIAMINQFIENVR